MHIFFFKKIMSDEDDYDNASDSTISQPGTPKRRSSNNSIHNNESQGAPAFMSNQPTDQNYRELMRLNEEALVRIAKMEKERKEREAKLPAWRSKHKLQNNKENKELKKSKPRAKRRYNPYGRKLLKKLR